jgi:preprotein translocase subunit SecA
MEFQHADAASAVAEAIPELTAPPPAMPPPGTGRTLDLGAAPAAAARPAPAASLHPKVGRNDPCPCGSGKKFKQCHGTLT